MKVNQITLMPKNAVKAEITPSNCICSSYLNTNHRCKNYAATSNCATRPSFGGLFSFFMKKPKTMLQMAQETGKQLYDLPRIPQISESSVLEISEIYGKINPDKRVSSKTIKKLGELFKNLTPRQLFTIIGIKSENSISDFLVIDKYRQPGKKLTFTDLGINENSLFSKVNQITGDCDMRLSNATTMGNVENIGGSLLLGEKSSLKTLANVKNIGKDLIAADSRLEDTGLLKCINGNFDCHNSQLHTMKQLEDVGGNVDMRNITIKSMHEPYLSFHSNADVRNVKFDKDVNEFVVGVWGDLRIEPESSNFSHTFVDSGEGCFLGSPKVSANTMLRLKFE